MHSPRGLALGRRSDYTPILIEIQDMLRYLKLLEQCVHGVKGDNPSEFLTYREHSISHLSRRAHGIVVEHVGDGSIDLNSRLLPVVMYRRGLAKAVVLYYSSSPHCQTGLVYVPQIVNIASGWRRFLTAHQDKDSLAHYRLTSEAAFINVLYSEMAERSETLALVIEDYILEKMRLTCRRECYRGQSDQTDVVPHNGGDSMTRHMHGYTTETKSFVKK
ncbi:structural maintenance of chromosomes protein 6 [Moniliophthora roreri]|nr:structural maintenance of chromosomes protein 6 [Moniliophthora roreri]